MTEIAQLDPSNMNDQRPEAQEAKSNLDGKQDKNTLEKASTKEKSSKPRHRASVACASCRDRRIRVRLLGLSQSYFLTDTVCCAS